jgi:hypothetical protein
VCVGLIDAVGVLGQVALHFGAEVDAGHLCEAREVDAGVGECFTEVGQALAPGCEPFADPS